jgi:hypothetical protein
VAVGAVLLAGCADADWLYRPRDAGAARLDSRVVVPDGAVGDRGIASDVDVVTTSDVPLILDSRTDADVGVITQDDVPTERDVGAGTDTGPIPTGLTVRAQGMATSAGGSATVGTLRVSETGFEVGERGCVGTLCVVGGLVP